MDSILIAELRVPATIGVHAWEQQIQQTLVIDLELMVDLTRAGTTDNLVDTIDYWHLCKQIEHWLSEKSFMLIEAVAETIATKILQEFKIASVNVTVAKPSVASNLKHVAVKIHRNANG